MKYVVYGKKLCPYCTKAVNLLERKDVNHNYIDIEEDKGMYDYLVNGLGVRTLPQVFVENGGDFEHIGGYEELSSYMG